ncbi:MAG: hypothetical protein LBC61_00505 [Candidatus Peribacteria bacterium]|jgi:hypothetical protein|nr:hypothetical protein [Candidatus Peribacteria bacterium]
MYNGVKLDETDISINSTNATQPMPTISIINQDNNNIDNVTISGNTIEVYISGANKTRITIELSSGNFTK